MPDAQPKPTTAEVLAAHWDVCGDGSLCDCGWQRPLRPGASTPGSSMHLRHQADMLAAAGLLATAEPTVVRVHYGDSEAHARSFNEGFETAVAQSLADDPALAQEWLAEHDAQVRRDACDALQQLRGGDIEQEYIDHVVTGCES